MPDDLKGKAFPDVSAKLSALPKKSLFERQKAEAEAKRAREKAETAAVYEDFVKSFEDDSPSGSKPFDARPTTFGTRGGGLGGGPARRHFTSSGPRTSGPGSLGPSPQSLSRKRTHEGFTPLSRNRDSAQGILGFDQSTAISSGPPGFNSTLDDDTYRKTDTKEAERAAAKPTLQLASLPPGTSPSVVKSLIPSSLVVDNVHITRPPSQTPTERKSSAAIVTLASDTAASDIDTAVSALQNKYLGRGYYLSLSRHLSSAAITSNISASLGSSTGSLPFGAKNIQPTTHGGSLNRAPPPGTHRGFAPPSSYGPNLGGVAPSTRIEVKVPSDIKQLRLIHKTLESLLQYGPEFEALLMSRPEVQREEKWAWIWDARSLGGVYYRWKLWQIVTQPTSSRKNFDTRISTIFEGEPDWFPPDSHIKFEYTTQLEEFVSEDDYDSSDEEHSDNEDERRNYGGGPPPEGITSQQDGLGYMNPLQKAKLTHLLARLPTTHAKLRRGDVARVTAFAIEHAGAGADEVVDMIVLNILNPLAYTGANPDRESEKAEADQGNVQKDGANTSSKPLMDVSSSKLVGLYVVSDILSSSATSGMRHAWRYRQLFESAFRAHKVFEHLGRLEKDLGWGRLKAEKWKRSVGTLLHLWEGWCVFPQDSHEHFVQMFEQPPLSEEELQKEEKAELEKAATFSKGKSKWKAVDDDNVPENSAADYSGPNATKMDVLEDESMSDIDGVPMEDSDLEDFEDGDAMEDDNSNLGEDNPTDQTRTQIEAEPEAPDSTSRRPRKARPKAEDMFASDSE
ncbi:hypothetical protein N7493_004675 [Penicillium malachiteum]|uniref:CID domain-containing protein n=1 Tax=Penicillium malachiteum TaxID=1324776 RepID=A0AAD6HPK5_9EURO|nr:hypothetical protein N7493_004675 [Penicillium malachiteum]